MDKSTSLEVLQENETLTTFNTLLILKMLKCIKNSTYSLKLLVILTSFIASSQSEVFKTHFASYIELETLHSTLTFDESHVYVIANDYNLYCYDKKTYALKYQTKLGRKTNKKPYFHKSSLFVSKYEHDTVHLVRLNKETGGLLQTLKIENFQTEPLFLNDSTLVATTLGDNGGQLVFYDLAKNQILWSHFVGHGISYRPYLIKNTLLVNFDNDTWMDVSLDGTRALDIYNEKVEKEFKRGYEEENYKVKDIPELIPRQFYELTHDRKELTTAFLHDKSIYTDNLVIKTSAENTVLLDENKLVVLKNKLKVQTDVNPFDLIKPSEEANNSYFDILTITKETVWFIYQNVLINYNFKQNKVIQSYDLNTWNPHQVVLEENMVWLISKNDGQLYGLKL